MATTFATFGIGWYYETGVQLLRLILSGVFDSFPDLQVIVGHWGEVVLFYLEHALHLGAAAKLPRPLTDCFRSNVRDAQRLVQPPVPALDARNG